MHYVPVFLYSPAALKIFLWNCRQNQERIWFHSSLISFWSKTLSRHGGGFVVKKLWTLSSHASFDLRIVLATQYYISFNNYFVLTKNNHHLFLFFDWLHIRDAQKPKPSPFAHEFTTNTIFIWIVLSKYSKKSAHNLIIIVMYVWLKLFVLFYISQIKLVSVFFRIVQIILVVKLTNHERFFTFIVDSKNWNYYTYSWYKIRFI